MSLNGLEKITDKILSDARERAEKILDTARTECERIKSEHRAAADVTRNALAEDAEREGKEMIARAKASAVSYRRNLILQTQSDLIDGVYESALAGTQALAPEAYTELLIGLLTAAMLEQAEAETVSRRFADEEEIAPIERYEILMNARDRDRYANDVIAGAKKKLAGKLPKEQLAMICIGERPVGIDGGLILRAGQVESNCSLSALFAQLREETEGEVSRALFESRTQA